MMRAASMGIKRHALQGVFGMESELILLLFCDIKE